MIKWIEVPKSIPNLVTRGITVLLQKSENLSNERDYIPNTCFNTCQKIFTWMVGRYMKSHADKSNIWDRSKLDTFSGVLGTVYQQMVVSSITDEVRVNKRNLTAAFHDMVRRYWMEKVYRWMGIPEKGFKVLRTLMEGLEFQPNGKVKTSRGINIVKGLLQGDSYSLVEFCLKEVRLQCYLEKQMATEWETIYLCQETHRLFEDKLKVYLEEHRRLEVANEIIVKVC